jgi:hypothetical protein
MSDAPSVRPFQQEVQRELGRALLRFQQLENALKVLVVGRFASAIPENFEKGLEGRTVEVMGSPLGWLKDELLERYVRPQGAVVDEREIDKAAAKGHVAFRHQLSIPHADHSRLKEHLTAVHARRNQLVHHFLDSFDLKTPDSCRDAQAYLGETHRLLDINQKELLQLAEWVAGVQGVLARFMETPEFVDNMLPAPGGASETDPKRKRRRSKKKGTAQQDSTADREHLSGQRMKP